MAWKTIAVFAALATLATPTFADEIKSWPGCYQVFTTCTIELPKPMTLRELSDFATEVMRNPLSPAEIVIRNDWPIDINRPDLESVEIVGVMVYL